MCSPNWQQIINDNGAAEASKKDNEFNKSDRAPPPQHHLESSRGNVKDRITALELQTSFGGRKIKDFGPSSKLGTGMSTIDDNNDIPTVGEMVNRKRGKRKRKGEKALVPPEKVGMNVAFVGPLSQEENPCFKQVILSLMMPCNMSKTSLGKVLVQM